MQRAYVVKLPVQLQDLLIKRAVKAMQNDDNETMIVKNLLQEVPDDAPAWLKTAIEKGEEIYEISLKLDIENILLHIMDWLRVDPDANKVVKAAPEKNYLGVLYKAADDFFDKQAKQKTLAAVTTGAEPGTEIVMTFRRKPNTNQITLFKESDLKSNEHGSVIYFWVKVMSGPALDREGKLMKHCVGSYAQSVSSNHCIIFSLRDSKNEPHATVELQPSNYHFDPEPTINQIKGKANQPPLGRYAPFIKDFINTMKVSFSSTGDTDIEGMGLFTNDDGKVITISESNSIILYNFSNGDAIKLAPQKANKKIAYRPYIKSKFVFMPRNTAHAQLELDPLKRKSLILRFLEKKYQDIHYIPKTSQNFLTIFRIKP